MLRRDRWRLGLVAIVVVAALVTVFPISGKINLGLDLKGGAHIVLQAKESEDSKVTEDSIERLLAVLRNRVDQYGVAEPVIQREGRDRVIVDLPGIQDPDAALELIGKTAELEFRSVVEATATVPPGPQRPNYDSDEEFRRAETRWNEARSQMRRAGKPSPNGAGKSPGPGCPGTTKAGTISSGRCWWAERTSWTPKPSTTTLAGRWWPSRSVPRAQSFLTGPRRTTWDGRSPLLSTAWSSRPPWSRRGSPAAMPRSPGASALREASRLSIMLRAGALPIAVEVIENRSVGPSLGEDSINSGIRAGLIGASLVFLFMLLSIPHPRYCGRRRPGSGYPPRLCGLIRSRRPSPFPESLVSFYHRYGRGRQRAHL